MDVLKALKAEAKRLGLKQQADVAYAVGVTESAMSLWYHGKRTVPQWAVDRLAELNEAPERPPRDTYFRIEHPNVLAWQDPDERVLPELTYAHALRIARAAAVLSRHQLADLTGLSPSYLGSVETGQRDPCPEAQKEIIAALTDKKGVTCRKLAAEVLVDTLGRLAAELLASTEEDDKGKGKKKRRKTRKKKKKK